MSKSAPPVTDHIAMDSLKPPRTKSRSSSVSSNRSFKGPKLAVQAKNLCYWIMNNFQYVPILNNLNMNLEVGHVYGLLGPSGCGKTTFLRCLIGFQKVTSGEISVFGFPPRDERSGVPGRGLGYMPQDLALHEYLTIEEELKYFGNLYMIDSDTLEKRVDLLVKSLDLPEKTRLLTNLSGGQRRRVSFALTIVHKPRLIILDEPTVGCDPILRERIWESLVHFSSVDRMTIIITTHYIEEARRSHRIGFMRQGQILMEDSPNDLMKKMGCDTLEKVFLEIVMKKERKIVNHKNNNYSVEAGKADENVIDSKDSFTSPRLRVISSDLYKAPARYEDPMPRITVNMEAKFTFWYYYLTIIIHNIFIQIKRSPTVIIAQFVIPLVCLMCFSMLIGHTPHGIRVGVINEEKPANLSNDLIESVNKYVLKMIPFDSIDQVKFAAKRRHIYGWIHFKPNFTQALIERYALPEVYENDTQLASTVLMHLDVSHWPLSITTRRAFQVAFIEFLDRMMIKLNKNPQIARVPVDVPEVIFGTLAEHDYSGFREFVSVGVLVIMSYTIAFGVTVLVVIQEKTSLIFERNYAAGECILTYEDLRFSLLIYCSTTVAFKVTFNGKLFQSPAVKAIHFYCYRKDNPATC